MKTLYKDIGRKIREVRLQQGLTLEQLSEKCHRDWAYLSQIERGKDKPSIETLYLVSNALEIPMNKLFDSHKPPKPAKYDTLTMKIISLVKKRPVSYRKRVVKILQQIH